MGPLMDNNKHGAATEDVGAAKKKRKKYFQTHNMGVYFFDGWVFTRSNWFSFCSITLGSTSLESSLAQPLYVTLSKQSNLKKDHSGPCCWWPLRGCLEGLTDASTDS